jgi:hypothetical protein
MALTPKLMLRSRDSGPPRQRSLRAFLKIATASMWPSRRSAVPKTAAVRAAEPNIRVVDGDYVDWSRFEAWENTPKTRYRFSHEVGDEIDRDRFWCRQLPQISFVGRAALHASISVPVT